MAFLEGLGPVLNEWGSVLERRHKLHLCAIARWEETGGKFEPRLKALIQERDGEECIVCGAAELLSVDHIRPQQSGGHYVDIHHPKNLQTLCRGCNSAKGPHLDFWEAEYLWASRRCLKLVTQAGL